MDVENFVPKVNFGNYIDAAAGTVWGPRELSDFEWIYVVSGRAELAFGKQLREILEVPAHWMTCIYPGERHLFRAVDDIRISCIHLDFNESKRMPEPPPPRLMRLERDNGVIHELFRKTAMEFERVSPFQEVILRGIVTELYGRLCEYTQKGGRMSFSPLLEKMLQYIEEHLTGNWTRRDLADHFHVTPEYVNYLFKNELGEPPGTYRNRRRVALAYGLLLEKKWSIKEVAQRMGYADEYYFSRIFRKMIGFPPSTVAQGRLAKVR